MIKRREAYQGRSKGYHQHVSERQLLTQNTEYHQASDRPLLLRQPRNEVIESATEVLMRRWRWLLIYRFFHLPVSTHIHI